MEDMDFFSGKDEVDLTDILIKKIVSEGKWSDEDSLKKLAAQGARWNTKRGSVVFPIEEF